ncbi:AAA domain protein [Lotmaria passim]
MESYAELLNLNFMYSLRTGNLLTDMMIAALLPFVSGVVAYITRKWWPQFVSRLLEHFFSVNYTRATFSVDEEREHIYYSVTLRTALMAYVTEVLKVSYDAAELKYLSIPGKEICNASSYREALEDFCYVEEGPSKNAPMELVRDLWLTQEEVNEDSDDDKKKKARKPSSAYFTLIQSRPSLPMLRRLTAWTKKVGDDREAAAQERAELEAKTKNNDDAIQLILDRAIAHYRAEFTKTAAGTERYLYQPLLKPRKNLYDVSKDAETRESVLMQCNRYLLRTEKTFSTLFFPSKPRLMQLIDNFEHKTGKYAIPGYPQKLVLLLYGPPGTGKTSLAKAVAAYTNRHLFAISLSRISTDEELLQCMFSNLVKVNVKSNGMDSIAVVSLDPTKLVYILEDVDATSEVVLQDEEEVEAKVTVKMDTDTETEHEVVAKGEDAKRTRRLTIKGLTNALNGVLDFPQRIVIMTTNHIEKLHPSLLRPGVVTMKLHMHNLDVDCAVAMVTHYFSHTVIRPEQLEELRDVMEASTRASKADTTAASSDGAAAWDNSGDEMMNFSPAELEQRCAECETVDQLLATLRKGSHVSIF